jgi:hypothetical protein
MLVAEIEQAEARRRNSQNPVDQRAADEMVSNLKASVEVLSTEDQQSQVERAEAETQFRIEQAKVNDLQNQLDKLDTVLAGYAAK